jgi:1-acyl-sn-glycerol-3-phosphate acyltransferase
MLKYLTLIMFTLMGWKVRGSVPSHIKKCVLIAAPHTSNYDYILAMATFYKMKVPFRYLIKQEWLDKFLVGRLMKASGAIGVNRAQRANLVNSLADIMDKAKDLVLMVPPEGTRKLTRPWKTGFYYVALQAKVPIILSSLDYKKKIAEVGPHFMPSGDFKKDMDILKNYYQNISAKYPHRFSLDIYLPTPEVSSET